jgi:hypothetical protein
MDNFGAGDMSMPELKLLQNVGGEEAKAGGAKAGDLYIALYDTAYPDGIDVVVVDMLKTRTYWGRENIDEGPPACSSANADVKEPKSLDGQDCTTCEHRCDTPWLLSPADRRTKCLLNYNILAIKVDDNSPLSIRTTGISTKATKELITQLRASRALKKLGMHRGLVHISSEKKKTPSGEAFHYKFRVKKLVEDMEQAQALLEISTEMLGTDITELLPASEERLAIPEKTASGSPVAGPEKEVQVITSKDVGKVESVVKKPEPKPEPAKDISVDF